MQYSSVTSPSWANAEHTAVNCTVTFERLGPVPFTASLDDGYAHTAAIFTAAAAGTYGPVAEYEAPVVPPAPIPSVVDMAQARLALLGAGHLATVNAALAAMTGVEGEAARIEWEFRATVRRDSALVAAMAAVLSLDSAALDTLFTTASTL